MGGKDNLIGFRLAFQAKSAEKDGCSLCLGEGVHASTVAAPSVYLR